MLWPFVAAAGNAPFSAVRLPQPVAGARIWQNPTLCDARGAPFHAKGDNSTDDTAALRFTIGPFLQDVPSPAADRLALEHR